MDKIEAFLETMMAAPEVMQLSGSEALVGFTAWLTTADEFEMASKNPLYGPTQDAAPWCELVGRFCQANKLSDPREQWHQLLTHPAAEEREYSRVKVDTQTLISEPESRN